MNPNELVTQKDLQLLKDWMQNKFQIFEKGSLSNKKWVKSEEARKILDCSKGTLQNLLIRGELSASKVGGTLYYSIEDIEKMMDRNKLSAQN